MKNNIPITKVSSYFNAQEIIKKCQLIVSVSVKNTDTPTDTDTIRFLLLTFVDLDTVVLTKI